MKKIFCMVVVSVFVFIGCWDENVQPSTEPELIYGKYTLPQGDHDYDDDIVSFYHQYSSLILYKFTAKDFGWSPTGNASYDISKDTVFNAGAGNKWNSQPANELYVGEQLNLLQEKCFGYFPDTFMYLLPQKILLCSVLETVRAGLGYDPPAEERTPFNVYTGFQHIAVNWGNERIKTMTAEERNQFKVDVCSAFLSFVMGSLERPQEFFLVSSYTTDITEDQIYANGILDYDYRTDLNRDWQNYINLAISNSLEDLEAEGGMFDPDVDVNGKIREKYTIMVDFLKERYSFDIQAIGNDVE